MRGVGGTTLRGGQTVFHGIRMWGQLLQAGMMLGALIVVAVPAWNLWHTTTGADWYAAGMLTLAEVKLAVGYQPDSGQVVRDPDGTRRVLSIRTIASSVPAARVRERIRDEVFRSAWLGGKAGAGVIALFLAWFWYRGVQLGRKHRVRGAELATAAQLRRRIQPLGRRLLEQPAGEGAGPRLPARGHPVPAQDRDPAHHRLGHHRLGQDGADLRPGRTDPPQGGALRRLRQDGELHADLLRSRARRAPQPARRPGTPLVAVPGSPQPPRLRHDGGGPDPAAARQRRPVLGHRRPAALRERRGRLLGAGHFREPGARRPPPEDRPHGARPGHGRHGRAVDRRSRQPEDGAQRARHADRERERARVPPRHGRTRSRSGSGCPGTTKAGSCS